jgi:hypothetical protein
VALFKGGGNFLRLGRARPQLGLLLAELLELRTFGAYL